MKKQSGSTSPSSPQQYYGEAFKRHVVSEVQSGKISMTTARLKYGIGGKMTVKRWCQKYARLRPQLYEDAMKAAESSRNDTALEQRVRELERSLSTAHLKIESLEVLLEVAEEQLGVDIRKKYGTTPSTASKNANRSAR